MKSFIFVGILTVLTVVLSAPSMQGEHCNYNGQIHQVNTSFPSYDGCNTCFCQGQDVVACTLVGCVSIEICHYNGRVYYVNDSFPSYDNCNTCYCQASERVACTYRDCVPTNYFPSSNRN
ncbi:von Willebrand factor C and EGF domain-containing protein-like [Octopus sinensis]|uniref:von Willebrand factor C and EGF domain-containing protein-like n=1 Tax=Octopus sinensis TaxID=2607531 RepID=A0A6P7T4U7_9MOLL|nr:von Willebrand factor C and EGF domain-containing protein-like [Octopus sinensis]